MNGAPAPQRLIRIDAAVYELIKARMTVELNTPNKALRDIFGLPQVPRAPGAYNKGMKLPGRPGPMFAIFANGSKIRIF